MFRSCHVFERGRTGKYFRQRPPDRHIDPWKRCLEGTYLLRFVDHLKRGMEEKNSVFPFLLCNCFVSKCVIQ